VAPRLQPRLHWRSRRQGEELTVSETSVERGMWKICGWFEMSQKGSKGIFFPVEGLRTDITNSKRENERRCAAIRAPPEIMLHAGFFFFG
jgi:hypothetical protein